MEIRWLGGVIRGIAYKLQCVQSYSGQDQADTIASDVITTNTENMVVKDSVRTEESFMPSSSEYLKHLSKEELMDLCELEHLLDELEPLAVDADLLPHVFLGYQPPITRLPYGVRHCLKDHEMTTFRRLVRSTPPHFAIVNLWERTAITKMAVKHTKVKKSSAGGGRGSTREGLALVGSNVKASTLPLVAGTLTETTTATSRWGHQPSPDEVEEMRRNLALTQQASLVKHLEKKLAHAKGKLTKANKALAKMLAHLDPTDLPTDLETLSEEERILFRKIKRGVYDGTIENMHLYLKCRELVKILVKRESLAQVKHIAISLEAESGGVLVSLDKTTKGCAIIVPPLTRIRCLSRVMRYYQHNIV
ncbi:hypothetical protein ES332_D06G091700v1 [Gossypium tomentosum]|uniref:CRM domain-containing protein n=1 Tax=Gossypium tomentosum TaxID=34277 RepID=A0A5D2KIR2_GOSTO|nr:hypothetical protein ES332_D06G091700v1 [Gossypium tomentosum]